MKDRRKSVATISVHAGSRPPESVTRPKVPPIYATSVFSFDYLDQIDEVYGGSARGYVYSRMSNPGIDLLEEAVAQLEDGGDAVAFASGMAAITTAVLASVSDGDHVLSARTLYGGTYTFFQDDLPKRGVSVTFVDINDLPSAREALRPETKVVYCETISNPTMEVADLPALAEMAHEAGALLMVDNTFASPVLCRPLTLGADVVIHSGTKYLNGHSDGLSGVLAVARESDDVPPRQGLAKRIRSMAEAYGPTPSPFDAWLLLRGIRTLSLRVQRHSENALKLARFLESHPKVTTVHYPGLESSTHHEVAKRVLSGGFGGMLSFEVTGGLEGARRFIDSLEMVELVPSLAGVSTTVSHPGKTSHRSIPLEERSPYGIGDGLIRVSTGIEDYADIEADFAQALENV
ncbi:MAG TPA: aminotransferase class I/II-fold pyridoxal phosphate-dependent enzyme [Firmicutes bacterium]|nr:aminotransferase class I/II-fold pyridoxal phosphate-dependent enzyme [Candidatus Fermentithermobacillaceae bacterium]